jgi:NAD(P)-dependent dehydrogenase (short-subunit alcohol dehydrogenase family)
VMKAQRQGVIINISSVAAVTVSTYPYFSYYASKAGLNHMTRALAIHYAPFGIRANVIMPGAMDTPLIYKQIAGQYADRQAMVKARNAMIPMGFMGDAFDIARAAVFLASDEARYITGICLPVDGGLSCK